MTEAIRDLPDALVLGARRHAGRGVAARRARRPGGRRRAGLPRRASTCSGPRRARSSPPTLAAGKRPEAGERAAREWAHAAGAAGRAPATPASRGASSNPLGVVRRGAARFGRAVATPLAPLALATTAPGRPARARRGAAAARRGRSARSATSASTSTRSTRASTAACGSPPSTARTGARVIFGAPDAPRATVAEAVLASCAVPWIFAPVEIGGREYVDGGVWSPTNLDAVPAGRGSRVLVPDPDRGCGADARCARPRAAAAGYEGMALARPRRRGAHRSCPTRRASTAIGPDLMEPSRRARPSPPPATRRAGA